MSGKPSRTVPQTRALQILMDRHHHAPGDAVSGRVVVDWPKSRQVRGVRVGLVGAEETRITRSHGSGKNRRTYTYTERNPIIEEEMTLWGVRAVGWLKAMQEGLSSPFRKLDYEELPAGRHEYEFEFRLPRRALPSYAGKHAWVRYRLMARVDIPLGFDLTFEGEIPVVAGSSARFAAGRSLGEGIPGGMLDAFRADLSMDMRIHGSEAKPGSRIEGTLSVENRSKKKIRGVNIELVAAERARAGGCTEETGNVLESGRLSVPDPSAERQDVEFGIVFPQGAASYRGSYSEVRLALRAGLDIPLAFDPVIEVPLEFE